MCKSIYITAIFSLILMHQAASRPHTHPHESFYISSNNDTVNKTGELVDINGNTYETVRIGTQVWMAENLNVSQYSNGDPIPRVTDDKEWENIKEGAYSYYRNFWYFGRVYGAIYNWHAVNDERGLCPEGWRVPDDSDWRALSDYLDGRENAGGKLKARSLRWMRPNEGATDKTGFSALPGGYRHSNGTFYNIRQFGDYWTSLGFPDGYAFFRSFCNRYPYIHEGVYSKNAGAYVRCIKKD